MQEAPLAPLASRTGCSRSRFTSACSLLGSRWVRGHQDLALLQQRARTKSSLRPASAGLFFSPQFLTVNFTKGELFVFFFDTFRFVSAWFCASFCSFSVPGVAPAVASLEPIGWMWDSLGCIQTPRNG